MAQKLSAGLAKVELRKQSTVTEQALWRHLRSKSLNNIKFRRQQPIGNYIVDFVCFERKIIIELDGGQHAQEEHMKEIRKGTSGLKVKGLRYYYFGITTC